VKGKQKEDDRSTVPGVIKVLSGSIKGVSSGEILQHLLNRNEEDAQGERKERKNQKGTALEVSTPKVGSKP